MPTNGRAGETNLGPSSGTLIDDLFNHQVFLFVALLVLLHIVAIIVLFSYLGRSSSSKIQITRESRKGD